MSARITLMTAGRILRQLRHDHRTVALILLVPSVLLVLLRYVFDANPAVFDRTGLVMLGVFPFTSMFLVTSVAMLRERTNGTLERLLTTPVHKIDLLLGYGIAFALAAAAQATLASAVAFGLLDLNTRADPGLAAGLAVSNGLLGMAVGLFTSAFARSEFQAVQFMPVVVMPQVLLCGLLVPREQLVWWLRVASDAMPLSYSVEALVEAGARGSATATVWRDAGIVGVFTLGALVLAAATLRRRTD